jgi:hypothetical protein
MTIMTYLDEVKATLIDVLSLGDAGQRLNADSPLLGAIDDDDLSASTFETLGSLAAFVAAKRAE